MALNLLRFKRQRRSLRGICADVQVNSLIAHEVFLARQNVSAGVGYSSDGSFFSDLAVRYTKYASDYFNPYGDYISGFDDYLPEVVQTRSMADIVLTLGWRF